MKSTNLLQYDGKISRLYKIFILNLIFNIITLTIYRSWAKTKIRRYVYNSFSINKHRLEYNGTGWELFRGLAIAMLILFVLSFIGTFLIKLAFAPTENDMISLGIEEIATRNQITSVLTAIFSYILIFTFVFYANFSSTKYRLTRTSWQGIKGGLLGKARSFVKLSFIRLFFDIITIGFAHSRTAVIKRTFLTEKAHLGNTQFEFTGKKDGVEKNYIICYILTIVVAVVYAVLFFILTKTFISPETAKEEKGMFGIIVFSFTVIGYLVISIPMISYRATFLRYCWNNTKIDKITFKGNHTTKSLFSLYIGNIILFVITIGLATPVIINRVAKYFQKNVEIIGKTEDLELLQKESKASGTGEGLAELVDSASLDFDIGLF